MQDSNQGTVYECLHHRTSVPPNYVFKFLFWAFQPSIIEFLHCRLVIFVDSTYLRRSYKGILLIASTWNANNNLFPLEFAIVDKESCKSWNWFLKVLSENGVMGRYVCLISD